MTSFPTLPDPLRGAVAAEFAGEPVLWADRPDARRVFRQAMTTWLFAVPWTGFALFGVANGVAVLFKLFFVLIGFVMLATPFWRAWRARLTVYALSADRVAIIVMGRTIRTTSIARRDIAEIRRTERADGTGDLELVTGWTRDSEGDRRLVTHKLTGVAGARKVDALIRSERL